MEDPQAQPPGELPLTAYRVNWTLSMEIMAAPRPREWMDDTNSRFANRCLPLLIANQWGWFLLNPCEVALTWQGGDDPDSLHVECLGDPAACLVSSHFGYGVVTWTLPYLFRTPPGYNLWVRGPANWPRDGICALEGIVETDWSEATFTMNWKMTRPDHTVVFEEGEPICLIVPQRRGELERFRPELREIADAPPTAQAFETWMESRSQFLHDLTDPVSDAVQRRWQKDYFQGRTVSGAPAREHQSKVELAPFADHLHLGRP